MAQLTRDIQERMNNVAYRYTHKLRMSIQDVLDKPKYRATGSLRGSIRVKLEEATGYKPPVITIEFVEYGDFIGKRKLLWTKYPPIDKLADWVEFKGFADGSMKVPGYTNGAPHLPTHKRAERIAFAIARSKRNLDKHRRKPWKKEALPSVLREMNQATLVEFGQHIERILADAISKGK